MSMKFLLVTFIKHYIELIEYVRHIEFIQMVFKYGKHIPNVYSLHARTINLWTLSLVIDQRQRIL